MTAKSVIRHGVRARAPPSATSASRSAGTDRHHRRRGRAEAGSPGRGSGHRRDDDRPILVPRRSRLRRAHAEQPSSTRPETPTARASPRRVGVHVDEVLRRSSTIVQRESRDANATKRRERIRPMRARRGRARCLGSCRSRTARPRDFASRASGFVGRCMPSSMPNVASAIDSPSGHVGCASHRLRRAHEACHGIAPTTGGLRRPAKIHKAAAHVFDHKRFRRRSRIVAGFHRLYLARQIASGHALR